MKLDNLNMFPENRLKSLFGLEPSVLSEVIFRVLPVLEQNRENRLRHAPERKRRFVKNDGRPRRIKPIHKLLMTLLYLRQNTSATVALTNVRFQCRFGWEKRSAGSSRRVKGVVSGFALGGGQTTSRREMES